MGTAVHISLDYDALMQLCKETPGLQVELARGVMANFIDKVLKPAISSAELKELETRIHRGLHQLFDEKIGTVSTSYPFKVTLNTQVKEHLEAYVTQIKQQAYLEAQAEVERQMGNLKERIQGEVTRQVERYTGPLFERAVKDEVNRRLTILSASIAKEVA